MPLGERDRAHRVIMREGADARMAVTIWLRRRLALRVGDALDTAGAVVVHGTRLSGRSTFLDLVMSRQLTRPPLLIKGLDESAAPFTSLRLALRTVRPDTAGTVVDLFGALADAVGDPPGLIVVDDAHRLDGATLSLVENVANAVGARVVVSTLDSDRSLIRSGHALFAAAPRIPLAPLTLEETTVLLTETLDGSPDSALVARLQVKTGAHPGLIRALALASSRSGALRRGRGGWGLVGDISRDEVETAVFSLMEGLTEKRRESLATLALVGPVSVDAAISLVGLDDVDALSRAGLLFSESPTATVAVPTVAVAPPVLAQQLQRKLSPARRQTILAEVSSRLPTTAFPNGRAALAVPDAEQESPGRFGGAAEQAAIAAIHEAARSRLALATREWRRTKSLAGAFDYVRALANRGSNAREIDSVLRESRTFPALDPDQLRRFTSWEARWRAWTQDDLPGALAVLEEARTRLGAPDDRHLAALESHLREVAGDATTPDPQWAAALGPFSPTLLEACTQLSDGRAVDALESLDAVVPADVPEELLAGFVRAWALLMTGRLQETIDFASRNREEALAALDAEAVTLYSNVLAAALVLVGRLHDAHAVLNGALSIGTMTSAFLPVHVSNLAMTSVLRARRGIWRAAEATQRQVERFSTRLSIVPFGAVGWSHDFAESYRGGSGAEAGLWRLLQEHERRGYLHAVAMMFVLGPAGVWTGDQLTHAENLAERIQGGLLPPFVRYHRAMLTHDRDQLEASYRETNALGLLLYSAICAAELARMATEAGDAPAESHWWSVATSLGQDLGLTRQEITRTSSRLAQLSDREKEIAALIAAGRANQAIAEELFLSIRTVENHIHRIFRKLELSSRTELIEAWRDQAL